MVSEHQGVPRACEPRIRRPKSSYHRKYHHYDDDVWNQRRREVIQKLDHLKLCDQEGGCEPMQITLKNSKKMRRSRCYICLTRGHAYWNCPNKNRKAELKKGKQVEVKKTKVETRIGKATGKKHGEIVTASINWQVIGTDKGGWNDIWYVSDEYPRHMTPNMEMFDAKFEETTKENVLNTQDVSRNKYFADLDKEDVEAITKYSDELIGYSMKIEEEIFIDIEGMQVPINVNSYKRFIEFMKMTNQDKIAMRNRDLFRVHFEKMLDWFYTWNEERTVIGEIPPRLAGIEVCLFDVYKLVKCLGGYEKVTMEDNWENVSMGFGFPEGYHKMFKEMYERYLLLPDAHYEFARGEPVRSGYAIGDLQDIGAETNESKDQHGDSRRTPTEDGQDASMDNEAKEMCSKTRTSSSEETDPNIEEIYNTSGSIGEDEE